MQLRFHVLAMNPHPFPPMVLALALGIGLTSIVLSTLAYFEFKDTNYRRMLSLLTITCIVFSLAHGILLLWPQHPPIVSTLKPLSFTVLALGVFRLVALHPEVVTTPRSGHR